MLKKPVFIGITGSAGKTTTKELLLGMLSHKGKVIGNSESLNKVEEVAKTILSVRPTHDFCVSELGADKPDSLSESLVMLQPGIGIVTLIADDHLGEFSSRDAIAQEKGKLVASLPATGTAVLNADDELVCVMAKNCAASVITYGVSANADIRAENISAVWPDRLELTLVRGAERKKVQTQLCGSHWASSALAAIGGGLAAGMTLDECVEGIASVAPFDGRMQPVTTPDGVTFIRDDFKAPLWTMDACFGFMKAARAKRKIIVIGELSSVGPKKELKYAKTAKLAQKIADVTIFVGPWASGALKARKPGEENALRVFCHVRDAADYVNSITREGDLVLLKGTNKQDHLLRIIMARTGEIACWRDDCKRDSFCNQCLDRTKPCGAPASAPAITATDTALQVPPSDLYTVAPNEQVIIGLGNPGAEYVGTPHNIGYEVVDQLASSLGLSWDDAPEARIARGWAQGRSVCLVKIQMAMNLTGTGLKRLSANMAFGPEQCILVYDDLNMPLGSVRTRLSGSAGGHRGIASILEAFQTDAFRRVKVGVGQTGTKLSRLEYVLTAFDATSRAAADLAITAAHARVIEMAAAHAITR
ncbi:MAG: aminoacyl-tRNA hydrolase [Sulfuricella sp.]